MLGYTILRLHRLICRTALMTSSKGGELRVHTIDGKWQGSARYVTGRFDQEKKMIVPVEDPGWEAFVFVEGQDSAKVGGLASQEEAEKELYKLVRKHLGRRVFVTTAQWNAAQ